MSAQHIISPLTEVLYGTRFEIDGKIIHARENVEHDYDDVRRLLDRLLTINENKRDGQAFEPQIRDDLYDTIMTNVLTCKMFSSRYIGRCYITNSNYGENCVDIHGHVFAGARSALGARWNYSAFPYHQSASHFLPFIDLCFNFSEYMVPVCDFPNMSQHSDGKNYIIVNVLRTNKSIQRGFIKTDKTSMVLYRTSGTFINPAYADEDTKLDPLVTTYFNYDGSDIDFSSMDTEVPITDCTKDVPIAKLLINNPQLADAFRIGDEQIAGFHTAFKVSVMKIINS